MPLLSLVYLSTGDVFPMAHFDYRSPWKLSKSDTKSTYFTDRIFSSHIVFPLLCLTYKCVMFPKPVEIYHWAHNSVERCDIIFLFATSLSKPTIRCDRIIIGYHQNRLGYLMVPCLRIFSSACAIQSRAVTKTCRTVCDHRWDGWVWLGSYLCHSKHRFEYVDYKPFGGCHGDRVFWWLLKADFRWSDIFKWHIFQNLSLKLYLPGWFDPLDSNNTHHPIVFNIFLFRSMVAQPM